MIWISSKYNHFLLSVWRVKLDDVKDFFGKIKRMDKIILNWCQSYNFLQIFTELWQLILTPSPLQICHCFSVFIKFGFWSDPLPPLWTMSRNFPFFLLKASRTVLLPWSAVTFLLFGSGSLDQKFVCQKQFRYPLWVSLIPGYIGGVKIRDSVFRDTRF